MSAEDYYDNLNHQLAGEQFCLGENEIESCTHEWPNGLPASHINLETCYVECAICGEPLADINYQFPPELRAPRTEAA